MDRRCLGRGREDPGEHDGDEEVPGALNLGRPCIAAQPSVRAPHRLSGRSALDKTEGDPPSSPACGGGSRWGISRPLLAAPEKAGTAPTQPSPASGGGLLAD